MDHLLNLARQQLERAIFIVGSGRLRRLQDEDGLHDRGGAAWAAAQLGQDLPGLEGGDGAFAEGADLGVVPVDGFCRRDSAAVRRRLNGVRMVPPAPW